MQTSEPSSISRDANYDGCEIPQNEASLNGIQKEVLTGLIRFVWNTVVLHEADRIRTHILSNRAGQSGVSPIVGNINPDPEPRDDTTNRKLSKSREKKTTKLTEKEVVKCLLLATVLIDAHTEGDGTVRPEPMKQGEILTFYKRQARGQGSQATISRWMDRLFVDVTSVLGTSLPRLETETLPNGQQPASLYEVLCLQYTIVDVLKKYIRHYEKLPSPKRTVSLNAALGLEIPKHQRRIGPRSESQE
ncbi:hypothetical protein BH11PLA2_BH11PLA2_38450 [soil metagenome]